MRVTLVHELTHALQDQHFDLTKLNDAVNTSGEDFALTALSRATRTSSRYDYLFSLSYKPTRHTYFADEPDDTVDLAVPRSRHPTGTRPLHECALHLRLSSDLTTPARHRVARSGSTHPFRGATDIRRGDHRYPSRHARGSRRSTVAGSDAGPTTRSATAPPTTSAPWSSLPDTHITRLDPTLRADTRHKGWGGDQVRCSSPKRSSGSTECVRITFTGDTTADTMELADVLAPVGHPTLPGRCRVACSAAAAPGDPHGLRRRRRHRTDRSHARRPPSTSW